VQWAWRASLCTEQVLEVFTIAHVACLILPSGLPQRKHECAEWHVSIAQQSRDRSMEESPESRVSAGGTRAI
jgi:hypothetical protein